MSIFETLMAVSDPALSQRENALINTALGGYYRHKAAHDFASRVADSFFSSRDEDLQREDRELNIRMKRRALGLPDDDDDYQHAVNHNKPFFTPGVQAAFGKHASGLVPEPGFLHPKQFGHSFLLSDGTVLSEGLGGKITSTLNPSNVVGRIFGGGGSGASNADGIASIAARIFRRGRG